jgi:hypothetical protein
MIVGMPAFCVFLATVSAPSYIRWSYSNVAKWFTQLRPSIGALDDEDTTCRKLPKGISPTRQDFPNGPATINLTRSERHTPSFLAGPNSGRPSGSPKRRSDGIAPTTRAMFIPLGRVRHSPLMLPVLMNGRHFSFWSRRWVGRN